MAGGPTDEKAGVPAQGGGETARNGKAVDPAPSASADSPKPHGDKMEHAVRGGGPHAGGAGAASGGGAAGPSPSGDSPKPHGDKMEHAVREAAEKPPGQGG